MLPLFIKTNRNYRQYNYTLFNKYDHDNDCITF